MTIEQLPSGNWRIKEMVDRVTYSVTVKSKDKPSNQKAQRLIRAKINATEKKDVNKSYDCMTFEEVANDYIKSVSNILAKSTVKCGYESILRNLSDDFIKLKIAKITSREIQKEINAYSISRSPKTVKNASGFIITIMRLYDSNFTSRVRLPQAQKTKCHIPTRDEVQKILDYERGTEYEIPFILSIYGLRRSEIVAVTADDVEGNTLTIDKAFVMGELKGTKTQESTRVIMLAESHAKLIKESNYHYTMHPNNIIRELHRAQDALGIERFRLHAMRHYSCTEQIYNGVPLMTVCKNHGWTKGSKVPLRIYTEYNEALDNEANIRYLQSIPQ